jgi:hypothetical protein
MGYTHDAAYKLKEVFLSGNTLNIKAKENINLKLAPLGTYIYSIERQ